jgi:PAS domain-containing protein
VIPRIRGGADRGRRAAVIGAAAALGASVGIALLAVYGVIDDPSLNASGYASVGIAFALIAGIVGILAERLRRAVEAHERAEAELKAESARRVSEGLKGAILDASLDCLITVDHAGRVLEFNRAAEETFGYER